MKTILVPTDFSAQANHAIGYTVKLAREFNASIILYHSFIPFESGFYPYSKSFKENAEQEASLIKQLNRIKTRILKSSNSLDIDVYVDRGPAGLTMNKFCKKNKIDLIVMGTTGASGIKEVIAGSFTAETMTSSKIAVLAIPGKKTFKIPRKILFATDYSKSDIKSIEFLIEWSRPFKSQIDILHIDDSGKMNAEVESNYKEFKTKIANRITEVLINFHHTRGSNISEEFLEFGKKIKADILAISPVPEKGLWDSLFNKSITKTTGYHSKIPLLSIPIK